MSKIHPNIKTKELKMRVELVRKYDPQKIIKSADKGKECVQTYARLYDRNNFITALIEVGVLKLDESSKPVFFVTSKALNKKTCNFDIFRSFRFVADDNYTTLNRFQQYIDLQLGDIYQKFGVTSIIKVSK